MKIDLSRRFFLKVSGSSAIALALGCGKKIELLEGFSPTPTWVDTRDIKYGQEYTTICGYCAGGCGAIATINTVNGETKVVNIEGDPDHPINEGALCSKAQSLYQVANNERRLKKVLHRLPNTTAWEEMTWDTALDAIADKIKGTRDAYFEPTDSGNEVNRTRANAFLGGAANENEECYLYSKLARSLGIVYLEHQARI